MPVPIHQEIEFEAAPADLYELFMDSDAHDAFTAGGGAEISREPGGAFSCHGGRIEGRNVELVVGERIVQAWRPANWDAGVFSLVRIELQASDTGTLLTLDHDAIPEGQAEHLASGWHERYWEPLRRYLAARATH
jgi:activator of HSP90 ATPase